jgi:hydroxymethylbilane synthase
VEIVEIATAGDRDAVDIGADTVRQEPGAGAPHTDGDKSRWVAGLERALLAGKIDLAVHSAKDVPGELAGGLALLGAPPRAAAEDVLCGVASSRSYRLEPRGHEQCARAARARRAKTSTWWRCAAAWTPARKLHEDRLDAIVLARAGLQRLGREAEPGAVLDPTRFVPSPGQGTLALEGRTDDAHTREAVLAITDERTFACLRAERAVACALQASCDTPLGAHAVDAGCGCLHLRAWVGLPDGSAWVSDELVGGFYDPEELGRRIAERLRLAGADELLRSAEAGM